MQYSDSPIGTWAVCRVASRVEANTCDRHCVTRVLRQAPAKSRLSQGGWSAVARAGGHRERASNLWTLSAGLEPRKAWRDPCASVYYRRLVSHLHTQHSLLAPDQTIFWHISIHFHTRQVILQAC